MKPNKVYLGCDHAGFRLKELAMGYMRGMQLELIDVGCYEADMKAYHEGTKEIDYPLFAHKVAREVAKGTKTRGILVCGTGIGMSMAANKVKGVRAAVCTSAEMARMAREHNDANVLCLGERIVDEETGLCMVGIFLETNFIYVQRHSRRVVMIDPDSD